MPTESSHLAKAEHDLSAMNYLAEAESDYADWVTCTAFYQAVHLVEALFAHDNGKHHSSDHGQRERVLRSERRYSHIYRFYRKLRDASEVARYLSDQHFSFSDYMNAEYVEGTVVGHWLTQIRNSVQRLITA